MEVSTETVDGISRVFGTVPSEALANVAEPVKVKKVKSAEPKIRAKREGTKQDRAVAIFRRLNGNRKETISAIVAELGMSEAGATTYFYNAKKAAV